MLNELSENKELYGSYKEFTRNHISMKKDRETTNKNQEEMSTISEMKNTQMNKELKAG